MQRPQSIVQVMDSLHDMVAITPGVLDDSAQHVYSSGQCLALAMAIATATGDPVLVQLAPTQPGRMPVMVHAWVMARGKRFIEVSGAISEDELNLRFWEGDLKFVVSAADLPELHAAFLDSIPEQNIEVARSFVGPVLELAGVSLPTP